MMKHIQVFSLLLLTAFQSSCGQNQTKVQEDSTRPVRANYSEAQFKEADTSTVPISMVRNVKKARNGDILIASYLGVFRYDGSSFTNITRKLSSPRLSSFWDVLEDRKGNLWFASKDSGVYCFPSASLKSADKSFSAGEAGFLHFTTKNGLASNMALHIYEDRAGNIWFGASRYDGKSFRNYSTKDGFPGNNIRLLLEDKTGKLWFGAQGENLFVYDPLLPEGEENRFTVLKNKDGKTFNNVWSVIEDKKGNIWFGDVEGLWRYDGSSFTQVSHRGAYAIIQDKKGNIWTTGELNQEVWALSRYEANSLYNQTPTVTEIKSGGRMGFLGIVEADNGSIWYGSGAGVYRYDGKNFTDFKSKEVIK